MLVLVNEQGADTQSVGSALMPMSVNKVDGLRRRVGPPVRASMRLVTSNTEAPELFYAVVEALGAPQFHFEYSVKRAARNAKPTERPP